MKTEKRTRLSVDLEAYPKIKKMFNDAIAATGKTPTNLTILALEQLPDIVAKLDRERAASSAQFLNQHPRT